MNMNAAAEILSEEQAAKYLGIPLKSLRYMRICRKGPAYIGYGERTRVYRVADLIAFQDSCRHDSYSRDNGTPMTERAAISA